MVEEPTPASELDPEFEDYQKRPKVVQAAQILEPFTVDTLEGEDQHGKAGDFLVVGVEGERYPVDKEIFLSTYRSLEPPPLKRFDARRERVEIDWSGDMAESVADAVRSSLRERDGFSEDERIELERIHIEVEETPLVNSATVTVLEDYEPRQD